MTERGTAKRASRIRRLYDLVKLQRWNAVETRCATHPHEVAFTDEGGYSPLHAAARRSPPHDAMSALLSCTPKWAPTLPTQRTIHGETVLHLAVSCDAPPQIVRLVISSYPAAVSILDFDLRSPLHAACACYPDGASVDVIRSLLQEDASMVVMQDMNGETPLSLLGERYNYMLNGALRALDEAAYPSNAMVLHLGECWGKISLLVMAAYHGTVAEPLPNGTKWRMVHACAGLARIPSHFLRLALKLLPDEARETDEEGRLPLHLAASVLPDQSDDDADKIMAALVESYPCAARIAIRGRLPLDIAIETGRTWGRGIKRIVDANAQALLSREIDTMIYPSILSAMGKDSIPTTLYELVKSKPDLLKDAYAPI